MMKLLVLVTLVIASFVVLDLFRTRTKRVAEQKAKAKAAAKRVCVLCFRAKDLTMRRSWCLSGFCQAHCDLSCREICAHEFLRVVPVNDQHPL